MQTSPEYYWEAIQSAVAAIVEKMRVVGRTRQNYAIVPHEM